MPGKSKATHGGRPSAAKPCKCQTPASAALGKLLIAILEQQSTQRPGAIDVFRDRHV